MEEYSPWIISQSNKFMDVGVFWYFLYAVLRWEWLLWGLLFGVFSFVVGLIVYFTLEDIWSDKKYECKCEICVKSRQNKLHA